MQLKIAVESYSGIRTGAAMASNQDTKSVSKQTLYQLASLHSRAAITRLVQLMDSSNESVALGACKILLSKTIPDLKSIDGMGSAEAPIAILLSGVKQKEAAN